MLLSCVNGHTVCSSVHHVSSMWGELPSRAGYGRTAWTHWVMSQFKYLISFALYMNSAPLRHIAFKFHIRNKPAFMKNIALQSVLYASRCASSTLHTPAGLHSSTRLTQLILILAQVSVTIRSHLQRGPDNTETAFLLFFFINTVHCAAQPKHSVWRETKQLLICIVLIFRVIIFCQPWHLLRGVKDASTAGGVSVIGPTWQEDG